MLSGSKFAKGFKPSPAHKRGLGAPKHLVTQAIPAQASVELPAPLDQGPLGACTFNAIALALKVELALDELPSRLMGYYNERAIEGTVLEDSGAMISDGFQTLVDLGVCRESLWPYDVSRFAERPSFEAYEDAANHRVLRGAYRIPDDQYRTLAVCAAIASGSLVVWGTELDGAFEDLTPGDTWLGVRGIPIGGHAMVLHAYDGYGARFKTRSSWGDWCDGGSAWVSAGAVMSPAASDFWVVAK